MKNKMFALMVAFFAAIPVWAQDQKATVSPLFHLEMKAELPADVSETSGLFFHNGRLWTHNDSGGKPILYGMDTTTFEIVQKITLKGARNKDWEDVCTDGETVFVGNMGNNNGKRKGLKIYMFPLSAIPAEGDVTVVPDSIMFRFADQTNFVKRKDHDFDCEALFATNDNLYLLSKGWATGTTRLYRLPKTPGTYVAEVVNSFDPQGLVTGADYDRQSNSLVVVGYANKKVWEPFIYLIFDFDEHGNQLANHRFDLINYHGVQTEGITFFGDGRCFLSAETNKVFTARVFQLDLRKWMEENRKNQQK